MKRILMMIMCVVMAISLFGCGQSNEQKYMSLRNEVETEMKAYDKIIASIPDHSKEKYSPSKERFRKQYLPYHEKALPEIKAIQKRVLSKLEEMEKLSKKDLKLYEDYKKYPTYWGAVLKDAVEAEEAIIKKYK